MHVCEMVDLKLNNSVDNNFMHVCEMVDLKLNNSVDNKF